MTDYREKFLEAEQQALSLVGELESLKKEALDYKSASGSLQKTQEKIEILINNLSSIVIEEQNLIKAIKDIGTQKIIDEIEEISKNQQSYFSKFFLFIYILLGLNIILGILIIVF